MNLVRNERKNMRCWRSMWVGGSFTQMWLDLDKACLVC